ncbi:hypothetical protein NHQ30_000023 [Ciborinia camelliae]|nr:hypothetical protein NHQ30_000023 [Ciborinia camelliae]
MLNPQVPQVKRAHMFSNRLTIGQLSGQIEQKIYLTPLLFRCRVNPKGQRAFREQQVVRQPRYKRFQPELDDGSKCKHDAAKNN